MRRFTFILAVLIVAVTAVPLPEEERINGVNGWYVPQINGSFVWVSLSEGDQILEELEQLESEEVDEYDEYDDENENQEIMGRVDVTTNPVTFYLYTNKNPTKRQKLSKTKKSINNSGFDAKNPTRIFIHGWTQGYYSESCKNFRTTWLSRGQYNVIIVDWARARSVDFASSVAAVPNVGKKLARMLDYLVDAHGLNLDETELVGHSFGAHVAGYAGKKIENGMVRSITGLDVTQAFYSVKKPKKRLSVTDAHYVEVIHTTGGQWGFLEPIGKADFYPNGGKSQPGCSIDLTGVCDHYRSVQYYLEAVARDSFPSMKCRYYTDAVKNNCGSSYSGIKMGGAGNAYNVSGHFYVPVHSSSPYGYGYGA